MDLVPTPYEIPQPAVGPGQRRPVRRMERPVHGPDRRLGGVCAGLAEHLNLNVRHVRLAFILASLGGGAGIVVYLFLWALTPQALETPSVAGPAAVSAVQPSIGECSRVCVMSCRA